MKTFIFTTGDADGIGLEVTAKALCSSHCSRDFHPIVWLSNKTPGKYFYTYLKMLKKKWNVLEVDSLESAILISKKLKRQKSLAISGGRVLTLIYSDLSPAHWVEKSAKLCLEKKVDALITAPLSKTTIKRSGLDDIGHTDILKRVTKTKSINMGFIGNKFSVVLATDHIPINSVSNSINTSNLKQALINASNLSKFLKSTLPIAVLGLNPHAGEGGLLGKEDLKFWNIILKIAKSKKILVEGPLVPDAAFQDQNWKKYSCYLALYHDQGLIPFKLIHGQKSGVHISLGLPFVRTSVDHGTAKDIFDKNIANPNSMIDAISCAEKLTRRKANRNIK